MKLVNQQLIKDTNLKLIYNYIYQTRGISRANLAKVSNLSKTTVSALVDELIERKFIYDSGTGDSSCVGRKPNCLEIQNESYYVVVIRWEEEGINVHLVDISGITAFHTRLELHKDTSYVELSKTCMYNTILKECPKSQILGICIVVPAMIDVDRREIYATTLHLPPKSTADIVSQLEKEFSGFSVALLNDTACFAYGEKVYTNISEKDFSFINFCRGIGAALFIGDEMLGHASASYTQFGHYSIDPNGKKCACGNRGCLELMIGEDSLKDRLDYLGGSPALKYHSHITYADLGQAGLYGDVISQQLVKDIAKEFSLALANLICMVYPKLIIIGGNGKDMGPLFLSEIKRNLKLNGFRRMVDSVDIRYSLLDSNACFNGAMKYFFDIHYKFTQDMTGTFYIG